MQKLLNVVEGNAKQELLYSISPLLSLIKKENIKRKWTAILKQQFKQINLRKQVLVNAEFQSQIQDSPEILRNTFKGTSSANIKQPNINGYDCSTVSIFSSTATLNPIQVPYNFMNSNHIQADTRRPIPNWIISQVNRSGLTYKHPYINPQRNIYSAHPYMTSYISNTMNSSFARNTPNNLNFQGNQSNYK